MPCGSLGMGFEYVCHVRDDGWYRIGMLYFAKCPTRGPMCSQCVETCGYVNFAYQTLLI